MEQHYETIIPADPVHIMKDELPAHMLAAYAYVTGANAASNSSSRTA